MCDLNKEPMWFIHFLNQISISKENLYRKCIFGGDSSQTITLANMTFKQSFMCKLLINYFIFFIEKT